MDKKYTQAEIELIKAENEELKKKLECGYKPIEAVIDNKKYSNFGFGYGMNSNKKYKVLILWSDGCLMIHNEKMTWAEILKTKWQMGVQAFPIVRDCLEEK